MKIYIDGQFYSKEDAKISVFDHGLLYGDGVFEGVRFYNGRVFKLSEHMDRLFDSARAICLEIPLAKQEVSRALLETIRQNGLRDGYVRLLVTRGVGNLGLTPEHCKTPTLIIIAATIALYPGEFYAKGLKVITCATRRVAPGALSPAIKSLNYLNNILARIEATQAGCAEALMLNEQGYVAECSGDNIFIVKRGRLSTPPITSGALGGITREIVFDLAAQAGIPAIEHELTRYDVFTADECFLTGTAAEIVPLVCLDGRPVGEGTPGKITGTLIAGFHQLTQTSGTPIDD